MSEYNGSPNKDTHFAKLRLTNDPDYYRWARHVAFDTGMPEWLKVQGLIGLIEDQRPSESIDYEQVDWEYILAALKEDS